MNQYDLLYLIRMGRVPHEVYSHIILILSYSILSTFIILLKSHINMMCDVSCTSTINTAYDYLITWHSTYALVYELEYYSYIIYASN